jgi:hypothetical protein
MMRRVKGLSFGTFDLTPPKLHAKMKLDLFFQSIKASKEISERNLQKEGKAL